MLNTLKTILHVLYECFIPHFTTENIAITQSEDDPNVYEYLWRFDSVLDIPQDVKNRIDGYATVSVFVWGPIAYCYRQTASIKDKP